MKVIDALTAALKAMPLARLRHPDLGLQERIFAYELYYQFRVREEGLVKGENPLLFAPARIQGELNKRKQGRFDQIYRAIPQRKRPATEKEPIPDFLVHVPGKDTHNLAVAELKHAYGATRKGIEWDLTKLAIFGCKGLLYGERILIVYGNNDSKVRRIWEWIEGLEEKEGGGRVIDVLLFDTHAVSIDRKKTKYLPSWLNHLPEQPPSGRERVRVQIREDTSEGLEVDDDS